MALCPGLSSVLQGSPNVVYQGFATINPCPDVTDCTNLISQYRITEVEYHIINSNYTGGPDTAYRGFFFAVEGAAQSFAGGAVPQITWTVRAKLIIEFRGVR